jgi:hypothetical protein
MHNARIKIRIRKHNHDQASCANHQQGTRDVMATTNLVPCERNDQSPAIAGPGL